MHYKAFNLHFIIPFECPELIGIDPDENILERVDVRFSSLPEHLENVLNKGIAFEANDRELLLTVKDVGKFYIRNGNEILIEKLNSDVDEQMVRLYLFGSAIGALLQQRGYLTLHASAVHTDKGAVLFAGNSGAGKSTTLQEFLRRGYKKLSDDTIALYFNEEDHKVYVHASYPQSKIWQETADFLGKETTDLKAILPKMEKFALPTHDDFSDQTLPVFAIYILRTSNHSELKLEEVDNLKKFFTLQNNIYRKRFFKNLALKKDYFGLLTLTAKQSKIKLCFRPYEENTVLKLADMIEKDFV